MRERTRMTVSIEDKKVKTPKFRVSFPNLDQPKSFQGQAAKYSITMLFPKDTDLTEMKRAAFKAKVEKWGKDKAKWPKRLKSPFRDGDAEKPEMKGYEGSIFVTASAKADNQPGMVDIDRQEITGKDIYAGCYARAELIAFAYDTAGNMGISFSLQNIQKLGDGKKFSGKKDAKDVFESVEDQSEDADSYDDADSSDDDSDGLGF